jgi:branched-chain amino acid transport system permease protein
MTRPSSDPWTFLAVVAALAAAGPLIGDAYVLHVLILCFIWIIVVSAWDLVMGYAGIFNFAQLALFALGGYASGMLSISLGVPPVLAAPLAALVTGAVGLLIALPCLRLRGEYVALFTFAVHLALPTLFEKGRAFGTGGASGLVGIPPIRIGDLAFGTQNKIGWYYLALSAAAAAVALIYFVIVRGRWGLAFVALRDSEDFARSLGIDDYATKLKLFVVSAIVTGFAGALYAHYIGVMTPRVLGNEFFLMVMVMLSTGGLGRYPGAILGAVAVTVANELLRETGQFRLLALGAIVVVVVILLPNGLSGLGRRLRPSARR